MDVDQFLDNAKSHIITETTCPVCKGAKFNIEGENCRKCKGAGVIKVNSGAAFDANLRGDIAKTRRWFDTQANRS